MRVSKYIITTEKDSKENDRWCVRRRDNKTICDGVAGYYFHDREKAEAHLESLESGEHFRKRGIVEYD